MQRSDICHRRLIAVAATACAAVLIPAAAFAATAGSAAFRATPAHPVTAYVANSGSGTVTPIRTATNTAGKAITVGTCPADIAITPDGKTAYVLNFGSGTVTPIDTASNTAGKPITVGRGPGAIAITP